MFFFNQLPKRGNLFAGRMVYGQLCYGQLKYFSGFEYLFEPRLFSIISYIEYEIGKLLPPLYKRAKHLSE
ncbi:hypothetical protein GCM10027342_01270 [Photobacterium alginatilyticum]